ncbi:hypothetical protein C0995_016017 [Termitomyces sp. Mi166|nr:hypothetical protein C0995_016017 [Termitomyces sp. Mi166\
MPVPFFVAMIFDFYMCSAGSKVSLGITIAIYSLLALVSLLGLAVGIYAIYRVFRDSGSFIRDCLAEHPPTVYQDSHGLCSQGLKIVKGVTVTIFIVFWLFEIYGCVIVKNYSRQLEDEYAVEGVVKDTESW